MEAKRHLTILAVDDDAEDAEILGFNLGDIREWEITFHHADTGEKARQILASEPIDVTFLDYRLGQISGLDLLNEIREAGDLRPVIVLTGQGDEYVAANLTRAGADDYIVKGDLGEDILRRAIEHAITKGRQRSAEAQLHEQAKVLAEINAELVRSKEVIETRARELEAANKKLEEVNELKTKFLSEVSHELRTPLTSVVSSAKIIKKFFNEKPESIERFADTILSEGSRLTRLLNNFLDLAKIESGCAGWNDEEVRADALVEQTTQSLTSLAMDAGLTLHAEIDPAVPALRIDPDRITQVLTNLLSNAIKHTPAGGSVTVCVTPHENGVLFNVRDTGVGIPPEDVEKVFGRFYQARGVKAIDPKQRGTGLGLCICVEIVTHYGGKIWAESTLGEGSQFKFTIAEKHCLGVQPPVQASPAQA